MAHKQCPHIRTTNQPVIHVTLLLCRIAKAGCGGAACDRRTVPVPYKQEKNKKKNKGNGVPQQIGAFLVHSFIQEKTNKQSLN